MRRYHFPIAFIGSILLTAMVQGQGIIIPRPCRPERRCPPPPQIPRPIPEVLKLKSIHFSTRITDQAATTHVTQVFENDSPHTLEGTYFFPLPDNVSITEFAMWEGEIRLVGEVRSREEARRIYDEIVRSRRDPALLEYAGKNLFQASVFPIQAHSEKKIELTFSQVLRNENGTVSYRYPLGVGWRANGFFPGPPRPMPQPVPLPGPRRGSTQEFERRPANPNSPAGARISAELEIASRAPIKSVYSPSHSIEVKRDGERKARLSFESRSSASQPDFQLFYSVSDQDFGLALLTHREPGKDGFFMLLVSPKASLDEKEISNKDVIFVLDVSGSMAEDGKMEKARAALKFGVTSLNSRDRFNIISFAGEEHLLSETLINGDEGGKKQAREFIEKMKATGGTNINEALLAAFKQLQPNERPQMIVLITDGQPTVGETKPDRILGNAKSSNKTNARLFTFGIGYDVNTLLLDGLANENRGAVDYIEPNEDIEIKVSNFFAKVNHPVLSDIKIDWAGVETSLIYPRAMSDIFHGSQLALIGRYAYGEKRAPSGDRALKIVLAGKVNGREKQFAFNDLRFPARNAENDFLPHLWAMRRVGHLMDQIRFNGESKELRDEIVELGTRYGIVTPYTSNLVLEPGMVSGGDRRATNVVTIEGAPPAARHSTDSQGAAGVSGRRAVTMSKQKEELREADKLYLNDGKDSDSGRMRQVAGKTFYLHGEVWTDSEFKAEAKLPAVNLEFAGDEFFQLIGQEPQLADYFSLGRKVVVVWKGKVYKID